MIQCFVTLMHIIYYHFLSPPKFVNYSKPRTLIQKDYKVSNLYQNIYNIKKPSHSSHSNLVTSFIGFIGIIQTETIQRQIQWSHLQPQFTYRSTLSIYLKSRSIYYKYIQKKNSPFLSFIMVFKIVLKKKVLILRSEKKYKDNEIIVKNKTKNKRDYLFTTGIIAIYTTNMYGTILLPKIDKFRHLQNAQSFHLNVR
eukprot:TRINITY_DN19170_c0_g4_i1.p1 TRINITY_DN19170_c0_g4~~TRINITY_DN19170_c0_g4_i1.p1  ORF type:complete len:197 (-),score=-19.71 TRINITY_DN19170_c0_g4_i1:111-701(-)